MAGRHHRERAGPPIWRTVGAALAAFAMGVQLVLSAWLIVQSAAAAEPALAVICNHDGSSTVPAGDDGVPPAPASHSQCPVCVCVQSAKILAPPPETPRFVVLRPRAPAMPPAAGRAIASLHRHTPYASRAPPFSA